MLDAALKRAVDQIGRGEYFEAHETLEDEWHRIPDGDLRTAVQGLIQLCAGLHKKKLGQPRGADYLLKNGLEKVERCGQALPPGAAQPFLEKARMGP